MRETDEIAEKISAACDGHQSADVMMAIGIVIAHAIDKLATDKNPDATFNLLRQTVDLELSEIHAGNVTTSRYN